MCRAGAELYFAVGEEVMYVRIRAMSDAKDLELLKNRFVKDVVECLGNTETNDNLHVMCATHDDIMMEKKHDVRGY
ncbi:hypothetical protein MTO96_016105 [Rhipicephalus appendiculatus]